MPKLFQRRETKGASGCERTGGPIWPGVHRARQTVGLHFGERTWAHAPEALRIHPTDPGYFPRSWVSSVEEVSDYESIWNSTEPSENLHRGYTDKKKFGQDLTSLMLAPVLDGNPLSVGCALCRQSQLQVPAGALWHYFTNGAPF